MDILGILYLNYDPAACLLRDGKIVAMAEEERFVKNKHAKGNFPINAIRFCLKQGDISLRDVKFIAVGWDVNAYKERIPKFFSKIKEEYKEIIDEESLKWMENSLKIGR